jgi:hypothetical protein
VLLPVVINVGTCYWLQLPTDDTDQHDMPSLHPACLGIRATQMPRAVVQVLYSDDVSREHTLQVFTLLHPSHLT